MSDPESSTTGDQAVMAWNIRRARDRAGMSQTALADQMVAHGRSTWRQTTVSRAEQGTRTLTYSDVRALDRILRTNVTDGTASQAEFDVSAPGSQQEQARQMVRSLRAGLTAMRAQAAEMEQTVLELEAVVEHMRQDLASGEHHGVDN